MKNTLRKIAAFVSAFVMCAVPMLNNYSASALTQYKTYDVSCYYKKTNSKEANMAYFDLTLKYNSGFTAEKCIETYLCRGGTFRSTINTTNRNIQCTYMGDPIKSNGYLASAKVIAPMSTLGTDNFIYFTSKVIRDINGNALDVNNIILDKILLGDVNQDGKVTKADAECIIKYLGNQDENDLTERQKLAADVYSRGDGVTGNDANRIMEYVNGKISHF